jgi:uncharacterized delta-60 repeat protein
MLVVNSLAPLIHLAGPASALAVVAAVVSARMLGPARLDVPFARALRFAFVDAIFLGFGLGVVFPLVRLPLELAFATYSELPADRIPVTIAMFVAQFYVFLWAAAALRRQRGPWRHVAVAGGCVAAAGLAWSVSRHVAERATQREEVARKIDEYERATGQPGEGVSAEIELSLRGFYGRPEDLAIDALGRLAVVGDFSFYAGHEVRGLARLGRDGALDAEAVRDTTALIGATRIHALRDGSLLIDLPDDANAFTSSLALRTLRSDGALEQGPGIAVGTWSPNAYERRPAPFDVDAAGRIVVARAASESAACVERFLPDGTPDDEFSAAVGTALESQAAGAVHDCAVSDVRVLADGGVLVQLSQRAESGEWRADVLRRLAPDGSFDAGFAPDVMGVHRLAIGVGGEIYAATLMGGERPTFGLTKLDAQGTRDAAFAAPAFSFIDALAVQPDGKLLVGARSGGGSTDYGLFRLLPDGRVDAAFGEGGHAVVRGFVTRIVVDVGGEIHLLGDFMDVGVGKTALPRYQIARFTADGSPDAAFDPR